MRERLHTYKAGHSSSDSPEYQRRMNRMYMATIHGTLANATLPKCPDKACAKPMVVVDLPSPNGVGVIPATRT